MVLLGAFLFFFLAYKFRKDILLFFLLFTYGLSFVATSILQITMPGYDVSALSFLYLLCLLLLFFYPYRGQFNLSDIHSNKAIMTISQAFCVTLIPATFYYGYYGILTILVADLSNSRIEGFSLLPNNIFNTALSTFATLYFVPLFLYFVLLKDSKCPLLRTIMLFSTLSYPLLTLCYSGRDGILYWGMNVALFYLLFRGGLRKTIRKQIRFYFILLSVIGIAVFILISTARFGEKGIFISLLDYLGMQTHHFSVAFHSDFLMGSTTLFPGWYDELGLERRKLDIYDYSSHGLMDEYNVFGFFARTVYLGYGMIGAFLVAILCGLFTRRFINNFTRTKNPIDLIIFVTLFQIPMNGLFYYRQGIGKGDVIYTLFLILLVVYKYFTKNNQIIKKI